MCCLKFDRQNTQIFDDLLTKNRRFEISYCGENREIYNNRVNVSLREDVHTKHGGFPHPPLRSAVPMVCGVRQVNYSMNRYNFGCVAASDFLFDSRGIGFRGQAIRR